MKKNSRTSANLRQIERLVERILPVLQPLLSPRTGPSDVLNLLNLRHVMKAEGFSTEEIDARIRADAAALATGAPATPLH